jgi:hypothetical protein
MELNGALSNPFVTDKSLLLLLEELRRRLLEKAHERPRLPGTGPLKRNPVLETVTLVLERAERPMRAKEVHDAANKVLGRPLSWSSDKETLSAHTLGGDHRFNRVSRGVYEVRS